MADRSTLSCGGAPAVVPRCVLLGDLLVRILGFEDVLARSGP